ncbi:mechanosensitive ion channel [Flavobacteriaceae bacterium Ap0902]|nr:mechanosensitive ion channel [Flavobacteriaceae bacterium Ap0902]
MIQEENTQKTIEEGISSDVFNLRNWDLSTLADTAIEYGLKAIGAILIIIVGFWLAGKISKLIQKSMSTSNMTISMRKFIESLFKMIFKILVILVAMSTVGFQVTAFVALLGGLAVGVGMALQGSLANLAGGILILIFKPFKVGDYIQSLDKMGTVEEISVLQTILLTPDMRTVILPNGSVFNNPIENYSKFGVRRVEIGIGIGYEDDFDKAKEVLMEVFKNEPLMLDDRDYVLEINEFGDNSVNLAMYGYTRTENYLQAKWNLNRATKKALDSNGFNIPFPQRDLHLVSGFDKINNNS